MSYDTVEGLWLTRLRAMSAFNGDNTARGKWGILNKGRSNQYAILKPGAHSREWIAFQAQETTWQTIIQLWQRYAEDGTSIVNLQNLVDDVLAELDTYPNLGDTGNTVVEGRIVEVREVRETPADAPSWLYVELVGQAIEHEGITFAE